MDAVNQERKVSEKMFDDDQGMKRSSDFFRPFSQIFNFRFRKDDILGVVHNLDNSFLLESNLRFATFYINI